MGRGTNHHTGHADITERSDRMTTMTSTAALAHDSTANTTYWIEGMQKDQEALGSALAFADACTSPRREEIGQENVAERAAPTQPSTFGSHPATHTPGLSWATGADNFRRKRSALNQSEARLNVLYLDGE